jgi:hypothetical protein
MTVLIFSNAVQRARASGKLPTRLKKGHKIKTPINHLDVMNYPSGGYLKLQSPECEEMLHNYELFLLKQTERIDELKSIAPTMDDETATKLVWGRIEGEDGYLRVNTFDAETLV